MCDAVFRTAKKETLNFLNGTERCIFGWNCFYKLLSNLIFYFFPCSFLHTSHLKPASKRPLFRSGYSECVLDRDVDRDMFFPCSAGHCGSYCLQILLIQWCIWNENVVYIMVWMYVARFHCGACSFVFNLSRKFNCSPDFKVMYRNCAR